jgi:phage terminase small subunit
MPKTNSGLGSKYQGKRAGHFKHPRRPARPLRTACEQRQPGAVPGNGLTPAQQTFALEYLGNGFNARRAYLKAHPKVTIATADVEGHRTLRDPKVRAFLEPRLEEGWKTQQMLGDEALARMAQVARADIRLLFDEQGNMLHPHNWPSEIACCVKSLHQGPHGWKVTLLDPLQALRTILEQTGKLSPHGNEMDALAAAIRSDLERHGEMPE